MCRRVGGSRERGVGPFGILARCGWALGLILSSVADVYGFQLWQDGAERRRAFPLLERLTGLAWPAVEQAQPYVAASAARTRTGWFRRRSR